MRLSVRECVEMYHKYNNPNMRRLTDAEYRKLVDKYPEMKKHIARQELAERKSRVT